MQTITLKAKTHHAKNRLSQWGTEWFIIKDDGQSLLIGSVIEKDKFKKELGISGINSARWIDKSGDPDFIIVKEELEK